MPDFSAGNFVAWMEQAFLLASAGALLPLIFSIREPRGKLLYCHALLAVILALPWIQPARASASQWTWLNGSLLLRLLLAGAALKLLWLLIGLWRIRKSRIASMPLYPIPEPVRAASAVTQTDALFCISPKISGPVMLGWLTPVVLLPESFLSLEEEAQCGIACHELLHVRRHDWLVTMLEELAGTLLWVNPAVWPLLAQARLAREQLVDAEVVRLTASRESYIEALLAIARGGMGAELDLAPAPLFLRKRHLTQRVHLLLKDSVAAGPRLAWSYASIAVLLAITGWFGAASFPLMGRPVAAATQIVVQTALQIPPLPQIAPPMAATIAPTREAPQEPVGSAPPDYASALMPPDSHEPVGGPIRPLESATEQEAMLNRFKRAMRTPRVRPNLMARSRVDVSFTAYGNADAQTGPGHLTQTWESNQHWRWTVNFGDFALDRIVTNGRTVENPRVAEIPMRVHDLLVVLPSAIPEPAAGFRLRMASARLNGLPATCLLTSGVTGRAAYTQARLWEEREYCIDDASGALLVYSVAPGTYTVYEYGRHIEFNGQSFPDRIVCYTGGAMTLDAQYSITQAGPAELSLLPAPQMTPISVIVGAVSRYPINTQHPFSSSGLIQPVIVHAEFGRNGAVTDAEISAASDPALAQAALDAVKRSPPASDGATQQQAYINVRFHPK